jgi:SAM-dependent methyltransferase
VHEILRLLTSGQRVLDLGCAAGSFRPDETAAMVIRADLDLQAARGGAPFVCSDARRLPFACQSFDAVILNHSLEHFEGPATVLAEIGRILRAPAYLYVAVPDASTITDRLYRWLGRGGGHLNQFTDLAALVRLIEEQTGLQLTGSRLLFSSLAFLNRRNHAGQRPRRIYLVGGGWEWTLRIGTFVLRTCDRLLSTRGSIYGWACTFGSPVQSELLARRQGACAKGPCSRMLINDESSLTGEMLPWSNVCIRCGAGHASGRLLATGNVRRGLLGIRIFRCPGCGAENYFTDDAAYAGMR